MVCYSTLQAAAARSSSVQLALAFHIGSRARTDGGEPEELAKTNPTFKRSFAVRVFFPLKRDKCQNANSREFTTAYSLYYTSRIVKMEIVNRKILWQFLTKLEIFENLCMLRKWFANSLQTANPIIGKYL